MQAQLVMRLVDERVISSIVRAPPDAMVHERPARTRRAELRELLLARRAALRIQDVVEHIENRGDPLTPSLVTAAPPRPAVPGGGLLRTRRCQRLRARARADRSRSETRSGSAHDLGITGRTGPPR